MAHGIATRSNGTAAMAYVGQTPWHGLGQKVTEGAAVETWIQEAGFDWKAVMTPVLYALGATEGFGDPAVTYRRAAGQSVICRSDTQESLAVVGDDYKIVQPREVLEFFRDLTEAGGWHIHTAGVLRGGRKLWALARNHTEGYVGNGKDKVRGNLLMATSLDGSMRTHCGMTAIRVVCANTVRAALSADGHQMVKVSHRSTFDADAVKAELGVARESFDQFMARARKLAESTIGQDEARDVLRTLFGKPTQLEAAPVKTTGGTIDGSEFKQLLARPVKATPAVRENRNVTAALELFNGAGMGADMETAAGTAWGLLNAVTQHVDHAMGRGPNTRLDSAWFGRGADMKTEAMEILLDR
jgi:phage/plasmid-like protein (TIGR03299 family)